MNDESPECSTVTLSVALLVRLGTFYFIFLTEMNFRMCKGSVQCHHFSLSNGTCKIEELSIILAAFSDCKG